MAESRKSVQEGQARLSFPVAKARGARRTETFGSKQGCGPSEAPEPGPFSGHHAPKHGRLCCAHSNNVQFRSCNVGDARCLAKVGEPSIARSSHSAGAGASISRIRLPVKPVCAVLSKKRCAFLPTPRSRTCKDGFSSGQAQKRTLVGGGVRSGYGSGDNRSGVLRGSQKVTEQGREGRGGERV